MLCEKNKQTKKQQHTNTLFICRQSESKTGWKNEKNTEDSFIDQDQHFNKIDVYNNNNNNNNNNDDDDDDEDDDEK